MEKKPSTTPSFAEEVARLFGWATKITIFIQPNLFNKDARVHLREIQFIALYGFSISIVFFAFVPIFFLFTTGLIATDGLTNTLKFLHSFSLEFWMWYLGISFLIGGFWGLAEYNGFKSKT
jgi:hypothetical protein